MTLVLAVVAALLIAQAPAASALLTSRFYDAMRIKQLAPAAALRDAQLSLMSETRWASPHYWGAFGLQGEWK